MKKENDLLTVRSVIRNMTASCDFKHLETTKLVTAASEVARNIITYATEGTILGEIVTDQNNRNGVRITARDSGPGITDVDLAMKNGYSTAGSLGLGLPGAQRLVSEFQIFSEPGKGTTVILLLWKR